MDARKIQRSGRGFRALRVVWPCARKWQGDSATSGKARLRSSWARVWLALGTFRRRSARSAGARRWQTAEGLGVARAVRRRRGVRGARRLGLAGLGWARAGMASPSRRLQTKPVITCLKSVLIIYSFIFWVSFATPGGGRQSSARRRLLLLLLQAARENNGAAAAPSRLRAPPRAAASLHPAPFLGGIAGQARLLHSHR